MSSFTDDLIISPSNDCRSWILCERFRYWIDGTSAITVPEGFVTDFASIPRLFWNIMPPWGKYGKAAVVHDFLYRFGGKIGGGKRLSRSTCDGIFRDAMSVLGVPWITRSTMWGAVRAFGWAAWKGNR